MLSRFEPLFRQVLEGLAIELAPLGFRARKSDNSLRRPTAYGYDGMWLTYISHPAVDIDIQVILGIRHDAVEALTQRFTAAYSVKKKRDTTTLAGQMTSVTDCPQSRWTVATELDVAVAVAGLTEAIRAHGLGFYARFSSLAEVLAVCSVDPPLPYWPRVYNVLDVAQAKNAIAAAFLLGEREGCLELIERKTEFLQHKSGQRRQVGPVPLQEFLAFADHLKAQM